MARSLPACALILGIALVAGAPPAAAAVATLAADINTDLADHVVEGFRPRQLTRVGSRLVFVAEEPTTGAELWANDGTPSGTVLLRDACPGVCSGDIEILAVAGGVAFFLGGERDVDQGLWRTDGTRAGTFRLDVLGTAGARSLSHAVLGSRLFLITCPDECQLWTSDGTAAGTVPVQGGFNPVFGAPRELTVAGGLVYFFATLDQLALWRSDGTAAGTRPVRELPVRTSQQARFLTAAGARLFFLCDGNDTGDELWTSDGTAAGTLPLTRFAAPDPFVRPLLKPAGNRLDFLADDVTGGADLWTSDGTVAGTRRVTDFGFATPFPSSFRPEQLERIGNRLLFVASDGLDGFRLWRTDGTPASTAPVPGSPELQSRAELVRVRGSVLFPGGEDEDRQDLWASDGRTARDFGFLCGFSCVDFLQMVPVAGQAYIATRDSIFRSNGTPAGTRQILPNQLIDRFSFEAVAIAGGRVAFNADDGGPYGPQLWASDGTPAGTSLLSVAGVGGPGSSPGLGAALGGGLVFSACDGQRQRLWHTDGSGAAALPGPSDDCFFGSSGGFAAVAGGLAYAVLLGPNGAQLYRTDGTAAGTRQLTSLTETGNLFFRQPVVLQGKILVPVIHEGESVSFWTSNGTPEGTFPLFTLPILTAIDHLTVVGPELYFTSATASGSDLVWRSDGTAAGTFPIAESRFFSDDDPDFTRAGGAVYFVAPSEPEGDVLWRFDGGTATPVPLRAEGLGVRPRDLAELGGALLFFGAVERFRGARGLIRTDGTAAGTVLLAEVAPVEASPQLPAGFTPLGGRLLFAARSRNSGVGTELWATDGTAAGTVLVRDIAPGPRSSRPLHLTAAGGRVYFTADDGVHGVELWQSDGTAAGTRLVQDIAPGPFSSNPEQLIAASGRLYFTADDGYRGREVWSLPLDPALPACQPAPGALCLNGGRFRAEAAWRDFNGGSGTGTAVALTADTGYFWFFDPANVEVVLKVLDGRSLNGHFWTFYGALSNVEYTLTVTDTQTGAARRYVNPARHFASVGDTVSFGPLGAAAAGLSVAPPAPPAPPLLARTTPRAGTAVTAACVPSSTRLCLNGGRFAVEAAWRDFTGRTGVGRAVSLTADTGYFWFFDAANVETVVKVLDGRPLNGKFWLFYGALSNVQYTLTVTDTQTGERKTYTNPLGRFASAADTGAF